MTNAAALRADDYGFFGPDSPTWRVWSHPSALLGLQRSVVLEHFVPSPAAASQGPRTDPRERIDRTLRYFLTVAVGDSRSALAAAAELTRVQSETAAYEPSAGRRYAADDPEAQLWAHVTGWHSALKCYEVFGPGSLSHADEVRYWADCAVAAELLDCDPDDVPRGRPEVRAYFDRMRPRMCATERSQNAVDGLLRAPIGAAGPVFWVATRIAAPATVATLPRWMQRLGGFEQADALTVAMRPAMRAALTALAVRPLEEWILAALAPGTAEVLREHRTSGVPAQQRITRPVDARRAGTAG
ncbi:oxygenase MpaB family protein [Tsukamurella sp. 8F]|uniref:oxygenase MpaB family protein n=1 Tax=unclassified Tsukamurella TaxID=2633480 RepID=UPI0023B9A515|nr:MULTISPECIES: oxygenase MpaB family protein [unclassified Tsukamurella]MDF0532558.1 oxygenase MpaB family protein [Tsukamurella sp. 8J]MDF0585895.1 oxygenase MpaB family protein [Tsukamurella sp. 8F]